MAFDVSGKTPEVKPVPQEIAPNPEAEVEVASAVEHASIERVESVLSKPVARPVVPPTVQVVSALAHKDPLLLQIEETLADESIAELYKGLTPEKQVKFKETGEQLARDIRSWIEKGKLLAHTLLTRVQAWLRQVVAVNKWYVEQAAKIIVDNVLALAERPAALNNAM